MLAIVHTVALSGLDGQLVRVEVDMGTGLPGWEIVSTIADFCCASPGSSRSRAGTAR
ncbi:MAG: hypothetical protein M0028_00925 [Clostridia bacterium]|nr:hypothetical protein [Clostridia bacterium]